MIRWFHINWAGPLTDGWSWRSPEAYLRHAFRLYEIASIARYEQLLKDTDQ